jgi:peptide/nickel transport system permease protein
MGKYAFHRLLMMVGILIGVLTITFALSRVLPGSPIEMMLGQHATPEQIRITKAEFGLDKPIPVQYYQYVKGIFQGDFGISLRTRQPVLNGYFRTNDAGRHLGHRVGDSFRDFVRSATKYIE